MKCLRRNKRPFEYLPYTGVDTDLDDDGFHTGEFHRQYGKPVKYMGNINTPSGNVSHTFYGDDIRYTHTLVMDDPNVKINEYGLIRFKGDLYEVKAVRPSLNSVSIALQRQTTEHYDPVIWTEEM